MYMCVCVCDEKYRGLETPPSFWNCPLTSCKLTSTCWRAATIA